MVNSLFIYEILKFFSIIILFVCLFTSCEDKNFALEETKSHSIAKKSLQVFDLLINPKMVDSQVFLSGDKIPFAANAYEWKKALELKTPVWCYSDHNKKGVLYNYYAVCDKRGIQIQSHKLTPPKVAKLLAGKEIKWNMFFEQNDCIQKGVMGNSYNINYLNCWIQDSAIQGQDKYSPCLIIDYKTNQVTIQNINKGNGFHLLDIN